MGGRHYIFSFFFLKQFLHLHYHPQPHLNLPFITDHGELWQEWVMLGNGEVGFVGAEAQGEGKGSGVVVVVVSVVLGGPRGGDLGT